MPSAVASAAPPVTLLAALPAGLEFLAQGVVPLLTGGLALLLLIVVVAQLLRRRPSLQPALDEALATRRELETQRDAARSELISLKVDLDAARQALAAKPAAPEGPTSAERRLQNELLHKAEQVRQLTQDLDKALKQAAGSADLDGIKAQLDQASRDKEQLAAELTTEKERSLALRQERDGLAARVASAAQQSAPLVVTPVDGDSAQQVLQYQQMLVQQGKLATLGQLIAGIIHEINTPLGAINAATGSFHKTIPVLLHDYPQLVNALTEPQRKLFFSLLDTSMTPREALSSKEERTAKRTLTESLESRQVPNASVIAANLVKAGLVEGIEAYAELFKLPNTDQIFEMLSNATKIKMNMDNTEVAMAKMTRMVTGLKNYSHPASGELEPTNLKENINTVLTVYHNKLKYGVEVSTHFDPALELIQAYPDELTQVWTNLIHNAVDAMEGKGSLDIAVNRENGHVRVDITDSGPGVPADIAERIWQPFFTTKAKGQGTGLGLDIVRRIVERHKGSIGLATEPGKTTFTVRLPQHP